ncbi:TetR/AcrR family transcriptional regulator [Pseudoflavonifractor sp. AF19-9AC]|uniref:TetR/AcrR family transcriptional regulator n=1 Tax=Pseudoflavonifractor sp. AF19-9AC TaxID=2292244 RepID=UPI000E46C248|nr:TetR/AcrR family transcriptional regulator [Pseudoflavonifractor sp. AF19-9AC]RHR10139.1 TetR/AcrR family transcriptional regulator [Pseudoflavonifractor sp. AF19-9AC]
MPKIAYSEEEREQIRSALVNTGLKLMAKQGFQHTTVEQIYKAVGISRTFFYTFFPTKEDLILEVIYVQQPKILAFARTLMEDPSLSWREGVRQFLHACCYGERNGIAVLSIEEQQMIFRRLSEESSRVFRERQASLFGHILECFGIEASRERIQLFTNLSLAAMVIRRAIPQTLPFLVPEAADATVEIQINTIVACLEKMKEQPVNLK